VKSNQVWLWSITVALSGLLFGLDVAVISGAEQAIQQLWKLSNSLHGWAISMALYGTVLGAAFGGKVANALGRKRSLFWVGIVFLVSAVGSAMAHNVWQFMVVRFLGGCAIGASSVISPLYIAEIAPAQQRGRLVALFQFNIVFGILLAYVLNYLFASYMGEHAWRWMLGVVGIPSVVYTILCTAVPESPRWLIQKGRVAEATVVLERIDAGAAAATLEQIQRYEQQQIKKTAVRFFSKAYVWPILLCFLMAFFNQASGINAIIYFAPRVFELAGLAKSSALLSSAGIGLVNLLFTMLGVYLIDKSGRRTLLYIGSVGYIISLACIAYAFYVPGTPGMVSYVFLFIAAHAIGQGAVIWVFVGEIFPNEVRAAGQSFGCLTHWVFAALLTNVFPLFAAEYGPAPIFSFFAAMMVLQLLYVHFWMPETKGIALEEMDVRIGH
jgi:MFS transporter, SP family, arabinose:H+ symporter